MFALLAFCKDANMAAWHPFEKDGQFRECFILICRKQASNAVELAEKLSHRYFTAIMPLPTKIEFTRLDSI
jgi:hypothetical protein